MTTRIDVLDHGYVELIESWGSDERIIETARVSTQKGFLGWGNRENPGDEKLLRFLHENRHSTPFEFAGMTLEIQAPIFVFREWHRHRTQSYSEMSARYAPLPELDYIPSIDRLMMAGGANRQAGAVKGSEALTPKAAQLFREALLANYALAQGLYQSALSQGIPKELARVCLPVGRYSRMRASANLRNWLAFVTLRSAENAQWEIRQYSDRVGDMIAAQFPRTWSVFKGIL